LWHFVMAAPPPAFLSLFSPLYSIYPQIIDFFISSIESITLCFYYLQHFRFLTLCMINGYQYSFLNIFKVQSLRVDPTCFILSTRT
jgi:hypothetical protein